MTDTTLQLCAVAQVYGLFPSQSDGVRIRRWRRPGVLVIGALVLVVAIPLAVTSYTIALSGRQQTAVSRAAVSAG